MIKKIFLTFISIILLAIIGISCFLQTDYAKKIVEKEISILIEKQTGSPIKIAGLRLQFPLIIEVEKIHSEQFSLKNVYAKLSVLNLLRGDIVIRKILAESVTLSSYDSSNTSSLILKNIPHFHIDFFFINQLHFNTQVYSIEGELHSGEDFSSSLKVLQPRSEHPFYFEINGSEIESGIAAHLLCRHEENHLQGLLTLEENETSFKDISFLYRDIQGKGDLFLNAKKEWNGTALTLIIHDIQPYCGLTGQTAIQISLSGAFDEPHFTVTSKSQQLTFKELSFQDCLFQLAGQWNSSALETTVQSQFHVHQNKIDGSCHLTWNDQPNIVLENFQLASDEFNCLGSCTFCRETHRIQGNFHGAIPHYQAVYNLTLNTNENKQQCCQLTASSKELTYDENSFSNLIFTASLTDIFESPKGSVKLSCEDLTIEMFNLKHVNFESLLDWSKPTYAFSLNMQHPHGFVQSKGFWNFNHVELVHCSGNILDYPFLLEEPFTIQFDSGSYKTTPIEAYLHEGRIAGFFEKNEDIFHLKAEIQRLPLQLLQYPTLPKLRGDADLNLSLSGPLNDLDGTIDIELNQVEILEDIQPPLPPFDAKLKAHLSDQGLYYQGNLTGSALNSIYLDGHFTEDSIALHFEAKDEITQFMQLLFLQKAVHMTGEASVVLDVEGTFRDPRIHGEVVWKNGTFEHPETGILYKGISGILTAEGKKLVLNQITATDLAGGTLSGSGSMELSTEELHPFSLDLTIKNTQLLNLEYATATGDGALRLSGNIQRALLSGTVQADSIKIRIPDEARPNIPTISVNYINQAAEDSPPTPAKRAPPVWPVALDLICEIKKPISIKAKNLRSTWNGNLHIKGDASTPLLYGDFKVMSGEYNFRGKIFDIKEGAIFFSGDKNTSLYVVGSQEIDDIKADVILKGPLKSPSLSFRSNPSMPQREIVSYILFGHRSSELTPFQGTELSESITDLNTTYKPDLLSRLTEKIGIDKLDISSNDVKVGKYITKGVLISFDKSMNAEANHLSIEAKVIKDIKLEGQIGDDAEGQLNIKWKKDY